VLNVAAALSNIAVSDAGRTACVTSGAAPALVALSFSPAVRGSAHSVQYVALALVSIATSVAGKAACVAAGAVAALEALAVLPVCKTSFFESSDTPNSQAKKAVADALKRLS
jgi:hypothetical protein